MMKAVDIDTNEVVAMARWELNLEDKSDEEWDIKATREWDEGTNAAAANHLIATVVEKDRVYMQGKPHYCKACSGMLA